MIGLGPKKGFSLLITLTVLAGLGIGLVGGAMPADNVNPSLVSQDSIDTQADNGAINICGDNMNKGEKGIYKLLSNLFNFMMYGGALAAFALTIFYKFQDEYGSDSRDWTDPLKGYIGLIVIMYGGAIAMDMVFGITVTCALPGFPG